MFRLSLVVVGVVGLGIFARSSEQALAGWYDYNPTCQQAFVNYPVSDGYMHGFSCAIWGYGSDDFKWGVWSQVWTTLSYKQLVQAQGADRCSPSDPWNITGSANKIAYNVFVTETHNRNNNPWPSVGYYQDCGQNQNHEYRNYGNYWRWKYSYSSMEGQNKITYW